MHSIINAIRHLEKPFMPKIEEKYRASRWRSDLLSCLIFVGIMILIEIVDLHTDIKMQLVHLRQHDLKAFTLIKVLSIGRIGFMLYTVYFGVWLLKMLRNPTPLYQKYDLLVFFWLVLLVTITSCTSFTTPRWYNGGAASHIPALILFYLLIPQHNFWMRIFPGLSFTVTQLILYSYFKNPTPLFGFGSIYTGYVLSNIIGIIFSHRLYMNERRNFALHRKKDRMTAMLILDKQKLQQEKELVASYEAELRKQEVQREKLKALQAQIKPHFLSNILTTIAYYCRTDADQAYQLLNDLAIYLQSTFKLQSQTIPWEEERKLVRDYLSMEAVRMEDRLRFNIDETGDLSGCHMPPFTLQPLVENAVRHGLAPLSEGGTLTIIAHEMPNHYYFEVSDNGRGFNPDQQKNTLPQEEKSSGGIGLSNIEERLQGIFGCGLTIDSRPGAGARISFFIPKQKQ